MYKYILFKLKIIDAIFFKYIYFCGYKLCQIYIIFRFVNNSLLIFSFERYFYYSLSDIYYFNP